MSFPPTGRMKISRGHRAEFVGHVGFSSLVTFVCLVCEVIFCWQIGLYIYIHIYIYIYILGIIMLHSSLFFQQKTV